MSLFSALRDGYYSRNDETRKARKARRSLDRAWSSPSRRARTQTISLVEMLEARELLSALVTTDQQDYAPGSTALFTATTDGGPTNNFQVGETVEFHITRTDGIPVQDPPAVSTWDVTDGVGDFAPYQDGSGMWWFPDTDGQADGIVESNWYVDPQFAGASLALTATGLTSGATAAAAFTDAATTITSTATGGNWSAATSWAAQAGLNGTITSSTGSATVTGTGTSFSTATRVGALIETTGGTVIGTVQSITNNTSLVLTANATQNSGGISWQTQFAPASGDTVTIATTGGNAVTVATVTAPINTLTVSSGAAITVASGGTLTTTGAVTITGTLTDSGGTFLSSNTVTVNSGGNVNVSGTGDIHMASTIGAAPTDNIVVSAGGTITQTGGSIEGLALTVNGTVSVSAGTFTTAGNLTVAGTLTVSGGTFNAGSGNLSGAGTVNLLGTGILAVNDFATTGTNNVSGGTLQVGHDFKPTTAFVATGGLVEFTGNGGGASFPVVTSPYSPVQTLNGAISTATQTTITSSGTAIQNGDVINIESEDLLVTGGGGTTTLTVVRGFNGTTAVTHATGKAITRDVPYQFYDVQIDGPAVDPAFDDVNGLVIQVAHNWTNNSTAAALTGKNTVVIFNGSAAQTIGGSQDTEFNNLTINNKGTAGVTISSGRSDTVLDTASVNQGALLVDGSLSTTNAITVNSSGTLGGTGGVTGVTVSGGTVDPGDTGGTGILKTIGGPVLIGTVTKNSPTVTGLPSTIDLFVGEPVTGTNIPNGTTILSIDSLTQITLSPSAGGGATASTSLTFNGGPATVTFDSASTFRDQLNGTTVGSGYDQLKVGGAVTLGGSALNLSIGGSFSASNGATFTIINNDSTDPVVGTFAGLAEGTTLTVQGQTFKISYVGGTGNDVVLTYQSSTTSTTIVSSPSPSTYGQAVTFTATVSPASGSGTPTGTVTFKDGVATLGSGTLSGGVASLLTTGATTLAAGTHTITAVYGGDSTFTTSTSSNLTQTVNQRALHVSATGVNKVYDGTTTATVTPSDDRLSGDMFTTGYTAGFDTRNVGTGKAVSVSGISISGGASANYTLANTTATTTANITTRAITVTAAANSKTYDRTLDAAATPTITSGSLGTGDTANFTETYDTKNVGTGKTLTPAGSVSDGNLGNNYVVTFLNTTNGTITARALTVTATGVNKVYDGTTAATVALSDDHLAGDVVTDAYTTASFATKSVATGKTVSVSGISISGADSGNYSFTTTATTTANITPAPLTITADNQTKVYGAALPTLTASYTGLVNGDTAASLTTQPTLSTTATASSHVAGSPYAITASGAVDSDYAISYVAGNLTVTAAALSITADDKTQVYGGVQPGLTASYVGLVNGDTAAAIGGLSLATAPASSHVGSYVITATGATSGDYTISLHNGTLSVDEGRSVDHRRRQDAGLRRGAAGAHRELRRPGQRRHRGGDRGPEPGDRAGLQPRRQLRDHRHRRHLGRLHDQPAQR